ncbi:tetratricopeptide repeat protein [Paraburkholderia phenazinium]|jgi:tetratricopeptide (TPR) repeat protein|uniref:Tetratricopeptide repeat-containing protein n=1 Tax=Paraburkholderia phenazinium TaxID=60549 RepID=A0A1G8G1N7_9BURK|nr:tetratricopeptide repeat protein [Paraburkholderia phenazinium]SDH88293.1 Tetratricopeptide repeat-containing protein [Paraburkholderia phenazinium]
MKERLFVKLSGVVLACGVMAGCATQGNNVATTPEAFNKSLADADTVAKSGDQDRAIALYQDLSKTDPTREEPWSRIAQIQFTQGHYGQAIVAAQEALQRDQTDRQAKSVLAVAGLRVATQSLGELRQDASLAGDAKTDAQALAKELRDTLGEATLFPPDDSDKPVKKKRYVKRIVKKPETTDAASSSPAATTAAAPATPAAPPPAAPAAPAAKPAAPAKAAQSGGASDPFSALR